MENRFADIDILPIVFRGADQEAPEIRMHLFVSSVLYIDCELIFVLTFGPDVLLTRIEHPLKRCRTTVATQGDFQHQGFTVWALPTKFAEQRPIPPSLLVHVRTTRAFGIQAGPDAIYRSLEEVGTDGQKSGICFAL